MAVLSWFTVYSLASFKLYCLNNCWIPFWVGKLSRRHTAPRTMFVLVESGNLIKLFGFSLQQQTWALTSPVTYLQMYLKLLTPFMSALKILKVMGMGTTQELSTSSNIPDSGSLPGAHGPHHLVSVGGTGGFPSPFVSLQHLLGNFYCTCHQQCRVPAILLERAMNCFCDNPYRMGSSSLLEFLTYNVSTWSAQTPKTKDDVGSLLFHSMEY
ncbi:hypothetical protein TNIN_326281 [Trichonephila inaurata madagascariensis]|uniref:Uncharacterized protein n=1 Tax=Trichonephila inaurata madagascariensis TaxID=2747483 RepID=A0A8X7BPE8_9ARAC|nr:hypothetical protein TNIN_326281 [Trichonephila inaurata madagascariensis]